MSNKVFLSNGDILLLGHKLSEKIDMMFPKAGPFEPLKVYPIPRGGIPAAYAVLGASISLRLCSSPGEADIFIDDIIDSGETLRRYCDEYPGKLFLALIDKTDPNCGYEKDDWIVFPWEVDDQGQEEGIEANFTRILQFIGEDPKREGLRETPKRFTKALGEWFEGYNYTDADIIKMMKTFEDGAEGSDEMVIRHDIPVYSYCEHHMAAIFGTCTVAYIPDGKVVGLSKMDRIVDVFARRMQVQERLTNQIADAMFKNLNPKGVGVLIKARHMCIESRGVKNHNSLTESLALRGVMRTQHDTRAEFLSRCK